MDSYQLFQLERYGNILPEFEGIYPNEIIEELPCFDPTVSVFIEP